MTPGRGSPRMSFASNDDYTIVSVAVIVFGLGFGGWYLWQESHGMLSALAIGVMHWQMRFIHHFTDRFDLADRQALAAVPDRVTFYQLVSLARETGRFFLYPAISLVLGLGALCFGRAAEGRYCRDLDLDGLIREHARSFRSTAAFARRRLGLSAIGKSEPRPADPALSAGEWIARYASGKDSEFDEAGARAALCRQLGPVWRGVGGAAPHVRCMLAAFALHAAGRREEALSFLGDLAESLPRGDGEGLDGPKVPLHFSPRVVRAADDWLDFPELCQPLYETMASHAFTVPAVLSALNLARRRSGVLAPAQFAFLKLVDRGLWYALHSLGFPSDRLGGDIHPNPRVEAAGARDHWAAERVAGCVLRRPALDRALEAIREAFRESREQSKTRLDDGE